MVEGVDGMIPHVLTAALIVAANVAMWPLAAWQGDLRESPREVTA